MNVREETTLYFEFVKCFEETISREQNIPELDLN